MVHFFMNAFTNLIRISLLALEQCNFKICFQLLHGLRAGALGFGHEGDALARGVRDLGNVKPNNICLKI